MQGADGDNDRESLHGMSSVDSINCLHVILHKNDRDLINAQTLTGTNGNKFCHLFASPSEGIGASHLPLYISYLSRKLLDGLYPQSSHIDACLWSFKAT